MVFLHSAFFVIEAVSLPYKWKFLDPMIGRFRKPNPNNVNSEQDGALNEDPRAPRNKS